MRYLAFYCLQSITVDLSFTCIYQNMPKFSGKVNDNNFLSYFLLNLIKFLTLSEIIYVYIHYRVLIHFTIYIPSFGNFVLINITKEFTYCSKRFFINSFV